jgi:hypothetical protein
MSSSAGKSQDLDDQLRWEISEKISLEKKEKFFPLVKRNLKD